MPGGNCQPGISKLCEGQSAREEVAVPLGSCGLGQRDDDIVVVYECRRWNGELSGNGTNDRGIAANDNVEGVHSGTLPTSIVIVPPYTDDEGEYFVPTASSFPFENSTFQKNCSSCTRSHRRCIFELPRDRQCTRCCKMHLTCFFFHLVSSLNSVYCFVL